MIHPGSNALICNPGNQPLEEKRGADWNREDLL
jgi:hypothetical protein